MHAMPRIQLGSCHKQPSPWAPFVGYKRVRKRAWTPTAKQHSRRGGRGEGAASLPASPSPCNGIAIARPAGINAICAFRGHRPRTPSFVRIVSTNCTPCASVVVVVVGGGVGVGVAGVGGGGVGVVVVGGGGVVVGGGGGGGGDGGGVVVVVVVGGGGGVVVVGGGG
eukprot:229775-Chlamydomonas_euryale.AAC.1